MLIGNSIMQAFGARLDWKAETLNKSDNSVYASVLLRKEIVASQLLRGEMVRTSINAFPKTGSKHEEIYKNLP